MLGAIVGSDRGVEANVAHRYEEQVGQGAFALAARVHHKDARLTRGIFIESYAFDVRNVEGNFIAKAAPSSATKTMPKPLDRNPAR